MSGDSPRRDDSPPELALRGVIVSLDKVCPACLAAYSRSSWIRLHAIARMRRAVADYARHGRLV